MVDVDDVFLVVVLFVEDVLVLLSDVDAALDEDPDVVLELDEEAEDLLDVLEETEVLVLLADVDATLDEEPDV